jgi:hypothetical protein
MDPPEIQALLSLKQSFEQINGRQSSPSRPEQSSIQEIPSGEASTGKEPAAASQPSFMCSNMKFSEDTTVCSDASTVATSNRNGSCQPIRGTRAEKQRLMEFTHILMKYLKAMNPSLYQNLRSVLYEVFQRQKATCNSQDSVSVDTLRQRLREVVGDCYFLRAEQYHRRYNALVQKQKQQKRRQQQEFGGDTIAKQCQV